MKLPHLITGKKKLQEKISLVLFNLAKKSQKLILPLTRRIDNKKVIEQASIIKALNQKNLNDPKIGIEIAKYLTLRLNTIESKIWNVKYDDGKIDNNKRRTRSQTNF